jgi:RNA polymerase primary sigma factor
MITECHNQPQSLGVNSNVATKAVEFIHSDEFESTTETQLVDASVELYAVEEQQPGSFDPDHVAGSILSALQQSRLLTFEGEQLLFKRLNFLRFRASALQAGLHPTRPSKKKLREIERLLADAHDVRTELATSNLRLVASIAGKLAISGEEFDEFIAEGNSILLYAIDKFDYSRGFRFSTYATHAVQRHLYRVIDRRRKRAGRENARDPEHLLNVVGREPDADEITESEVREAASAIMSRMDNLLTDREQYIVRGRFGLDGSGEGKTFAVLADHLGLSKERVRQLLQQSLEKLGEVAQPFAATFAPG